MLGLAGSFSAALVLGRAAVKSPGQTVWCDRSDSH
jgi:hypothetical protein